MSSTAKQRLETLSRHLTNPSEPVNPPKFELEDHPVDAVHHLKVAVIGAGISGTTAGVLLPAKVPGIELTIFEKNSDVGGTWFENIYPGVRCDIPANVYQSSYSPNTQWTEEFAQGPEIRAYWQGVARKHNVYQYIQFNTKVLHTQWDPLTSQWVLRVQNELNPDSIEEKKFDVLITAIGRFNAWKLPEYPGIEGYEGHLRHSSNWDPNFDPQGKRVAVIGNGASGIQIVPELQRVVKHLDHYARSKTWIAGSFAGHERKAKPMLFSEDQLKEFEDPEKYLKYRKGVEETYWRRFASLFKNSPESLNSKEEFKAVMARRLGGKGELLNEILPDFSPHCRRLTPGPGYLEALTKENVSFIRTPIKRFTRTGIEVEDGTHRPVDAIICSTGANIDYAPPFPIISGSTDLSKAWKTDGDLDPGFPYSYLGVASPGFPNLFFIHGPNASGPSGTFPNGVENQVTYIARVLRKTSREGIKSIVPKKEAADDFVEFCDAFFPNTVLSENCSSWANGGIPGGRIHGMWPGSAAHGNLIRRSPRWEDFEYELRSERTKNRFAYWGNGWTSKQLEAGSDLTSYLKLPDKVDLRDLHESWWDL